MADNYLWLYELDYSRHRGTISNHWQSGNEHNRQGVEIIGEAANYYPSYSAYRLCVVFEDQYSRRDDFRGGNYEYTYLCARRGKRYYECFISYHLEDKVGTDIVIERKKDTIFIFDSNDEPIGVFRIPHNLDAIEEPLRWSHEEEAVLWKYQRYSIDRLAKIFNESENNIRLKLYEIETRRTQSYNPNGIQSFVRTDGIEGVYILGAGTKHTKVQYVYRINNQIEHRDIEDKYLFNYYKIESLPICPIIVKFSIDGDGIINASLFKTENSLEIDAIKKKNPSIKWEEVFNNIYLSKKGAFHKIIQDCNFPTDQDFFIMFSLEDFESGDNNSEVFFSSLFFVISNSQTIIDQFIQQSSQFLRYIMYLRKVESVEQYKELENKAIDLNRQYSDTRKQANHAALSSIMTRNMSHNLGGHFLYYTQATIDYVANTLSELSNDLAPYVRGAAETIKNIRQRMTYLSTVVSDDWLPSLPVFLKNQILDTLLIDEVSKNRFPENISKRTVNFYLDKIVKSEGYARPIVCKYGARNNKLPINHKGLNINVQVWSERTHNYISSKGDSSEEFANEISKIILALPGGALSTQALYNILENFIRNSAKYHYRNESRLNNLDITISIKQNKQDKCVEILISDNKQDANLRLSDETIEIESGSGKICLVNDTLLFRLSNNCRELKLIDMEGRPNRKNKGLQEMMLSAFWLNANKASEIDDTVHTFYDLVDVITNGDAEKRQYYLNKYGVSFTRVFGAPPQETTSDNVNADLAIKFRLPLFTSFEKLTSDDINSFSGCCDVAVFEEGITEDLFERARMIFPRVSVGDKGRELFDRINFDSFISDISDLDGKESVFRLFSSINHNHGDITKYYLSITQSSDESVECEQKDDWREPGVDFSSDFIYQNPQLSISFDNHMSTKFTEQDFIVHMNDAYLDTISGGDYTKVIEDELYSGITDEDEPKFKTWWDYYRFLKVKESAITRITIIDERIFERIKWAASLEPSTFKGSQYEQAFRNVRVLTFDNKDKMKNKVNEVPHFLSEMQKEFPYFSSSNLRTLLGSQFNDRSNNTHFVTIHLNLIVQILSDAGFKELTYGSVQKLMKVFKCVFSSDAHYLHLCVDTGRGGMLSKEEKEALQGVPIINFETIDGAYNNSKYYLSEIFYNIKYR